MINQETIKLISADCDGAHSQHQVVKWGRLKHFTTTCLLLLVSVILPGQDTFEEQIEAINKLSWEERQERYEAILDAGTGTPLQRARYHHELGVVYFVFDDLFGAIEQTETALNIRIEQETTSGEEVAQSAYNLGSFYQDLENFDEAFAHFQLVVDRAPNSRLGYTLFRLGSLYRDLGEYRLGEQAFEEAGRQAPYPTDEEERATLFAEWADLYIRQNDPETARLAIPLLEEAYGTYRALAASDDYYNSLAVLALNRLGLAYNNTDDFDRAMQYFEQAQTYHQQCCEDRELAAVITTNMGIAHRRMGAAEKASQLHRQALEIRLAAAEKGKTNIGVARSYDNLASTLLDLDRPREGLESIQMGLSWALPRFAPQNPESNPDLTLLKASPHKKSLLIYLQDKAELWRALARKEQNPALLDQALATYHTCDQLIDLMREDHLEKKTKLYWREQARAMYQAAVQVAWEIARVEEVFYFSEKSRAVLLLDGLQELNANSRLPQTIRKQLSRVAAKIQYLEKLAYERDAAGNADANADLSVLQEQYRHLLDSVETAYPDYYRQKYRTRSLTIEKLQAALNPEEVWVEYFISDEFSLALVIDRNKIDMVEIAGPKVLAPLIEQLVSQLRQYDQDFDPAAALALYRYLIEPLDLEANKKVTFVTDGKLSLIPFEVLLSETPADSDYRKWNFLITRHQISYAFSANSHFITNFQGQRGNGKVLAFAPMAVLAPAYGIDELLELPQSRFTIEYIAELLPTDIYMGKDAQREQLKVKGAEASVLHLATHAFLDNEQPEFSYFLVAEANPDQRRLYVNELYQYQFQADLAVLSACETGSGKLFRGEGIASIGRAFVQNGCPNLTVSLWPVDEGATGRLLEQYYDQLEAGIPKAEALHRAKLAYLQRATSPALTHPFRWAGFVYYGQDTPLALDESGFFTRPFLLMVGLGLIAFLFIRLRRKPVSP